MRSPVRADQGALVGALPRQAHDVDAAVHRPRARAGGQADVSGQDDTGDAVFREGCGGQRAGRVDEDAARFDMDARAIAADVEDAVGLAGGFVAGPGGPRVDADAREGFLLVNVLGRQVGEARARIDCRSRDGVDGVGQALVVWRREHEGGSDARVTQSSPSGVPVKIKQSGVGEHARDRVGVRGPGEFVDNGRVGVGRVQCRKARTGHEARVGDAEGGSREVVVAVVVVVDESPAERVVSCARVVVGAVGRSAARKRSRVSRTDSTRSARVMGSAVVRVFVSSAPMRGGAQSWAARTGSCSSVRIPGVGVSELVGAGCAVRSRRLARVRASGLIASLRDEAVAGVVIVRPSTQQPCDYSTTVKRYGGATRRRWRRFPGQRRPHRRSAAMRAVATKSLVSWPRACWPEGCFFDHWRSGTTFSLATGGATRRAVRKHRAPNGALRRRCRTAVHS